jgi:1-acyl-sn-glycerol-3-phosphate acyltransferase
MDRFLKVLFFALVIRPVVLVFLGLNIRGRNNLPLHGPAIIAANHNSHLDAMVLMSLYPLSILHRIRPVAAADYFLKNRFLRWFSLNCIGIIPIERGARKRSQELFANCHEALNAGDILVIFPEGSRGEPEFRGKIKKGLFRIVNERTDTEVVPVLMHGLGRSLPRGEALLVPFNCDVIIGEPMPSLESAELFVEWMDNSFDDLGKFCVTKAVPDDTELDRD